jgi:hypothetical protein
MVFRCRLDLRRIIIYNHVERNTLWIYIWACDNQARRWELCSISYYETVKDKMYIIIESSDGGI